MTSRTESEILGRLVGRAGEWFVMAELLWRGYNAYLPPVRWPGYDILVSDSYGIETVRLEIKGVSSHCSTHADAFHKKDCHFLVVAAHLRVAYGSECSALGSLGCRVNPRFFVVPSKKIQSLVGPTGNAFYIGKEHQPLYEDKWHLPVAPLPWQWKDDLQKLRRRAVRFFVAAHLCRCGLQAFVDGSSEHGVILLNSRMPSSKVGPLRPTRMEGIPLAGMREVFRPIDIVDYRDELTRSGRAAFSPSDHLGLVAFVDLSAKAPSFDRFAVFDAAFLRKAFKHKRRLAMRDLVQSYGMDYAWSVPQSKQNSGM